MTKLLHLLAALIAAAVLAGAPVGTRSEYDVELNVGIVLDDEQNGKVIAAQGYELDPDYSYISYRDTDAQPGDIVLTICYLTPGTEDDIVRRDDYIIKSAR